MDGLFNMGCVDFRKHLISVRTLCCRSRRKLTGFVVVVPLAYFTQSYWALVAGMVSGRAAGLALSYALASIPPQIQPQLRQRAFLVIPAGL